jgi:hypothetical protein
MITLPSRIAMTAFALAAPFAFSLPAFADTAMTKHPAGHAIHHRHAARHRTMAAATPIEPLTPPARAAATETAAPMPNPAITPPVDTSDQSTTVAPAVMQIHYPPQGDGYTTGSSAQAMDDKQAAKVTGVQMHMPLGQ